MSQMAKMRRNWQKIDKKDILLLFYVFISDIM